MTFALALAAIRRHVLGVVLTALITVVTASLLGVSVPLALATWSVTGVLCLELWYAVEPVLLCHIGECRRPSAAEQHRVEALLGRTPLDLLIADSTGFTAARGLRCLVIGRDLLDIFEDRAMCGFLVQVAVPLQAANLAGFILVWLGNLPLLMTWWLTRVIGQLGRLLALAVGTSLVLPIVVFRDAFLRWAGLVFTVVLVSLAGAVLLSYGFAAIGLGLLLAWLLVPSLRAVLAWESCRAERVADRVTIEAGYGVQLLEAVDLLTMIEPRKLGVGVLSMLSLPGRPTIERARWIRRHLEIAPVVD